MRTSDESVQASLLTAECRAYLAELLNLPEYFMSMKLIVVYVAEFRSGGLNGPTHTDALMLIAYFSLTKKEKEKSIWQPSTKRPK